MFRCSDPDNFQFNQVTRQCVFQCRSEGRVADTENCQRYYECYRVGLSYVSRRQSCIAGFIYDATTKRCVAGSCPNDNNNNNGNNNGNDNNGNSNGENGNSNQNPDPNDNNNGNANGNVDGNGNTSPNNGNSNAAVDSNAN